jgi:hypothetical protein
MMNEGVSLREFIDMIRNQPHQRIKHEPSDRGNGNKTSDQTLPGPLRSVSLSNPPGPWRGKDIPHRIAVKGGRFIAIEVKARHGILSPHQKQCR